MLVKDKNIDISHIIHTPKLWKIGNIGKNHGNEISSCDNLDMLNDTLVNQSIIYTTL